MTAAVIVPVVDEGLGNSAYLVNLGGGRALAVDAPRDLRAVRAAADRGRAVAPGQQGPGAIGRHPPGRRDRPRRDRCRGAPWPAAPARLRPRRINDVWHDGDLVITVCDLAHEELGALAAVHWSVPDPVPGGDPASSAAALDELSSRITRLAPRLAARPAS